MNFRAGKSGSYEHCTGAVRPGGPKFPVISFVTMTAMRIRDSAVTRSSGFSLQPDQKMQQRRAGHGALSTSGRIGTQAARE